MPVTVNRCATALALTCLLAGCARYELDAPGRLRDEPLPPIPAESARETADIPEEIDVEAQVAEAAPAEETAPPERADAPEETIAENALPISRDGAILTALANNRTLEVARYGPRIAATYTPEARAAFDPNILATVSYGRRTDQLGGRTRFTFGQGTGDESGMPPILLGETLAGTVQNMLDTITGSLRQPEMPSGLDLYNSNGEVTVSNTFPTGTTVFLSGGMQREETNFYSEQFTGSWAVGVNQALLEGAGRAVNLVAMKQARNEALASTFGLYSAALQVVAQVERAYWELALAQEVLAIREFAVALAEEQLALNQDLVEAGRAVEGHVIAAKAERASRMADLHDARGNLRAAGIELLRLLNPAENPSWERPVVPVDPPEVGEIEADPQISVELAQAYRPELRQQELAIANRSLDVMRRDNERLPRLDISASYGRTSLGDDFGGGLSYLEDSNFDNYNLALELQTPILNRAEKARHTRATLAQERAQADLARIEHDIRAGVRQAAIEVDKQWERIGATEEAVRSRVEELRIERDRYQAGRATNLDVLQVQRLLIQAQVGAISARVRYIQALSDLYAAEGTLLARRGVRIAQE
ncbi:MAG: TolC family protein [Candidatus Hydrogenedentota bacterium]